MVINIITGSHFSQRKLYTYTNHFFGISRAQKIITSKDVNYIVKIEKKSVKIILSDNHDMTDIDKIKNYIKSLFENQSILIKSTHDLPWLYDIDNVTMNTI